VCRRKSWAVRTALPPLHGKKVEVISITRQLTDGVYRLHVLVDGQAYVVNRRKCRDELDVMRWVIRLQEPNTERRRKMNATANAG
jgi:hypothetical protein